MHEIFISYRQDDSAAWAVILRDALVARFGADQVYLDKDTQRAGDWKEQIRAGLARSKVVLVPIGPRWLNAATTDGQRRLDMPNDIHRWEIAQALAMPGITVIPICVERAAMPRAEDLSEGIRSLPDQQWRELSFDSARREVDIERLVADIERATELVAQKPKAARSVWLDRLAVLVLSFVVTLVTLNVADAVLPLPLERGVKTFAFLLIVALAFLVRRVVRGRRQGADQPPSS